MLTVLRIVGLAIIARVELELSSGLNILTGETGAGKSILIAALELVLGARGRAALVRTGEERAEVEALFELPPGHPLRARLAELELGQGGELLIRRVLLRSGRSRAYVNGRLTTLEQLRSLVADLVDISSQHEYHRLANASGHIDYLDAFGDLLEGRARVEAAWRAAVAAAEAVEEARGALRDRAEREDLLRFQLSEVRELDPVPDELETLEQAIARLSHSETLVATAASAESRLYGQDGALTEHLADISGALEAAAELDPALEGMAARMESLVTEAEELARDLADYAASLEADPAALDAARRRQRQLERLVRRHGAGIADVLDWRERAEQELAELELGEGRVDALEAELGQHLEAALAAARALSTGRQSAAEALSAAITGELRELGMGNAKVVVEVAPQQPAAVDVAPGRSGSVRGSTLWVGGHRIGATGLDRVQFLIAPNPGEEPRPLAEIASGGELSRSLLALKRVLAHLAGASLYVFDEIDTGVGGAISEVIGRKLFEVAGEGSQVLCITHSPQVAVYADRHLHVHKQVTDGRTHSSVRALTDEERAHELARMLGGIDVGGGSRAAADELLRSARSARAGREAS